MNEIAALDQTAKKPTCSSCVFWCGYRKSLYPFDETGRCLKAFEQGRGKPPMAAYPRTGAWLETRSSHYCSEYVEARDGE